jgi:hypothetical protein
MLDESNGTNMQMTRWRADAPMRLYAVFSISNKNKIIGINYCFDSELFVPLHCRWEEHQTALSARKNISHTSQENFPGQGAKTGAENRQERDFNPIHY